MRARRAAGDATLLRFAFPYGPGQRRGAIPTMLRQARRPGADRRLSRLEALVLLRSRRGARRRAAARRERDAVRTTSAATTIRARCSRSRSSRAVSPVLRRELIDVVDPPVGPAPVLDRLDVRGLHELGWRPEVELEDGMGRTFEWLSSPA